MNAPLSSISPLAAYISSFLSTSFPVWMLVLMAIAVHWFVFVLPALVLIGYLDRKLGADIQMRIGPNRVPVKGFLQSMADAVKMIFKEDRSPALNRSLLFRWGVVIAITSLLTAMGAIPMAESWALSNMDSGLLCVLFAMVFANLCIFWSAYSGTGHWSTISAFRVLAIIATYIVPIAITIVPVVLIAGNGNFDAIVRAQAGMPWQWMVFHNPGTILSFGALFVALMIWQGRVPVDHYQAPGEIHDGLRAQYSGLRRGLVGVLEYMAVLVALGIMVSLYLGGWQTPFNLSSFGRAANVVQWLVFGAKALVLALLYIWIRWSLPRLRIDQVIALSWRVLVPMGLLGTFITAVWMVVFNGKGLGDFI